jgi:hypothetical protein
MNITDGRQEANTRDCQRETGLVLNHLARHAEQNFWGDYYKEKRKSLDQVGNVCGRREKWAKEKGDSLALEIIKKVNQAGQSGAVSLRACMDIVCGGVYFCWPFRQINSQAANTHTHTQDNLSGALCMYSLHFFPL